MDMNSIECISSSDVMDEDEIHHLIHPQFPNSKPHNNVVSSAIHPTTSVHELLECPVCTNSMYPPIHQVGSFFNLNCGVLLIVPNWCSNCCWLLNLWCLIWKIGCFGEPLWRFVWFNHVVFVIGFLQFSNFLGFRDSVQEPS